MMLPTPYTKPKVSLPSMAAAERRKLAVAISGAAIRARGRRSRPLEDLDVYTRFRHTVVTSQTESTQPLARCVKLRATRTPGNEHSMRPWWSQR